MGERRHKEIVMPTDEQMYNFCKAHYYSYDDVLWEPFETWDKEDIEEQIDTDVKALKMFLNGKEF